MEEDMYFAYGVLALLILSFVYWLISRFLLKRIEDDELVDLIGYHWKDLTVIFEKLNEFYNGSYWARFFQYPGVMTLTQKLDSLTRQGYLEKRRVVRPEFGKYPHRLEYRRTGKKYPVKRKESKNLVWETRGIR